MKHSISHVSLAGCVAALAVVGMWAPGETRAQSDQAIHQDNGGLNGSISHEDLERLSGDQTQASKSAREIAEARAKAMAQSASLIKTLQISCNMTNAGLVVSGTRQNASGGKKVNTSVYEVACKDGVGCILIVRGGTSGWLMRYRTPSLRLSPIGLRFSWVKKYGRRTMMLWAINVTRQRWERIYNGCARPYEGRRRRRHGMTNFWRHAAVRREGVWHAARPAHE